MRFCRFIGFYLLTFVKFYCLFFTMPSKDLYHDNVRLALEKEGWLITHDPYTIAIGRRTGYIDLGAEMIAAEKGAEKIAVEIKSFLQKSELNAFEDAVGQFLVYLLALEKKEPDRKLWLAVPHSFYQHFFEDPFFVELINRYFINVLAYNEVENSITLWRK